MHLTKFEIDGLDKVFRLNLINSITGIKPANLIGTQNTNGQTNLAIFSSVVHLGSNPPLLGMITRPVDEVPRHTYSNIKETGFYTINSVPDHLTEAAHFTSAKFNEEESEFDTCGFKPMYIDGFPAPFVEESAIKIGLKLIEEVPLKINGTILLIGEIVHLIADDNCISSEGYLNLQKMKIAGISGLNSYYSLQKISDYPYARRENWLKEQLG